MGVPTDKPKTTTMDWKTLVNEAWGDELHEKEIVYEFSDGAKFKSTDKAAPDGSIYSGTEG